MFTNVHQPPSSGQKFKNQKVTLDSFNYSQKMKNYPLQGVKQKSPVWGFSVL